MRVLSCLPGPLRCASVQQRRIVGATDTTSRQFVHNSHDQRIKVKEIKEISFMIFKAFLVVTNMEQMIVGG